MAKKSSFICLHKRRFLYIIKNIVLLLNSQFLSVAARPPSLPQWAHHTYTRSWRTWKANITILPRKTLVKDKIRL